jgi:hypothetical protein
MSPRFIYREITALQVSMRSPAFAVEAGSLFHLLAIGTDNRGAVHLALSRDGEIASHTTLPQISVMAVAACGSDPVITGLCEERGVYCVARLDAKGKVRWETPLPIPTSGLVWVLPTCIAGEAAIIWEIEKENEGELGIASVRDGVLGPPETSLQPGVAFGMHVATIGTKVFVLRSRGAARESELLRVEDGKVIARASTVTNAQALAAVGETLLVLSWTADRLLLQWFDASLIPLGPAETIATVDSPSWIRFGTLHTSNEVRIAVSYETAAAGDYIQLPDGRSERSESSRLFLGCYDRGSRMLNGVTEITPGGTAWFAAAWIGDRFLLVNGTANPVLSVFDFN